MRRLAANRTIHLCLNMQAMFGKEGAADAMEGAHAAELVRLTAKLPQA
jgi:hypothetical protein